MVVHIKDLADVLIVNILEYLRAADLATVSEVDKTVFRRQHISMAVTYQMDNIYTLFSSPLKDKRLAILGLTC